MTILTTTADSNIYLVLADRYALGYAVYAQSHIRACLTEPRGGSDLAFANFDEIVAANN
jgi:hypothetical protein